MQTLCHSSVTLFDSQREIYCQFDFFSKYVFNVFSGIWESRVCIFYLYFKLKTCCLAYITVHCLVDRFGKSK